MLATFGYIHWEMGGRCWRDTQRTTLLQRRIYNFVEVHFIQVQILQMVPTFCPVFWRKKNVCSKLDRFGFWVIRKVCPLRNRHHYQPVRRIYLPPQRFVILEDAVSCHLSIFENVTNILHHWMSLRAGGVRKLHPTKWIQIIPHPKRGTAHPLSLLQSPRHNQIYSWKGLPTCYRPNSHFV